MRINYLATRFIINLSFQHYLIVYLRLLEFFLKIENSQINIQSYRTPIQKNLNRIYYFSLLKIVQKFPSDFFTRIYFFKGISAHLILCLNLRVKQQQKQIIYIDKHVFFFTFCLLLFICNNINFLISNTFFKFSIAV